MSTDPVVLDPPQERSRPGVLASIRRHGKVIAIGFAVAALLGYLFSLLLPTQYTAEASLYLRVDSPFTPGDRAGGDATRFAADQAEIIVTTAVLQRVGDAQEPPLPLPEMQRSVDASAATDTSRVTVTVVRPEAEEARQIADGVVEAYRAVVRERVAAAAAEAETVLVVEPGADDAVAVDNAATVRDVRLRAAAYGDGVSGVEPAILPEEPSAPLPLQNALLGGLLGLFLVTGFFVLRDQRSARRASVADLDLLLGAPLLARFPAPRSRSLPDMVVNGSTSEQFKAGHDVLTAIDVRLEGARLPSVLFLSWQQPLATTSLTVAVGLAAARERRHVVLVDGGAKERGISSLTDVDPGLGLEGLLNRSMPIGSAVRTWKVGGLDMDVVPLDGWSPTPTSAAARPQVLRAAIDRLRAEASAALTLVDGPPLTERSLGLALGRGVNGVVVVVEAETTVDEAHEMGRHLNLAGVPVLGYVLVGAARRRSIAILRPDEDGDRSPTRSLPATAPPRGGQESAEGPARV